MVLWGDGFGFIVFYDYNIINTIPCECTLDDGEKFDPSKGKGEGM